MRDYKGKKVINYLIILESSCLSSDTGITARTLELQIPYSLAVEWSYLKVVTWHPETWLFGYRLLSHLGGASFLATAKASRPTVSQSIGQCCWIFTLSKAFGYCPSHRDARKRCRTC